MTDSPRRGFTLIEILVVLVIMAIIVAAAVISIGQNTPRVHAREVSDRIKALVPLASQEALLQSRLFGLMITEHQYQLFEFNQGHWQGLTQQLFGKHDLPNDVKINLQVNDNPVKLPTSLSPPAPQILLFNSGDMTPFVILIETRSGGALYEIKGQGNGEVRANPITAK